MSDINNLFDTRAGTPSDISEHMPLLRLLASQCSHITEFGTRSGNSTTAFLAGLSSYCEDTGKPAWLVSYDIADQQFTPPDRLANWMFVKADTATLDPIAPTDMLLIDTLHDCAQVRAELKHADRVSKWLVFHDTVLFGWREESTNGLPGILQAIFEFMSTEEGRKWQVWSHDVNNCGLLVLRRAGS